MSNNVSVYLVDDHAVVREGYKRLLEKAKINVIAEADCGEKVRNDYLQFKPDVVVMDLSMPGMSGLETLRKLLNKDAKAKILIFSMHDSIIYLSRALQAGARGYLSKSSAPDVLVEAILTVANGKRYISPDIAQSIATNYPDVNSILSNLSAREFEVFQLLSKGLSLDSIANTLHLDYKTVANTQTRLKQKLNVENSSQLVIAAIQLKVLHV